MRTVADLMSRGVVTIHPWDTLRTAAARMRESNVGMLVAVDGDGQPAGVLTDRDIVTRAVAKGLDGHDKVSQVMTQIVVACREDLGLDEAGRLMELHGVRRLVVTDAHAHLSGVLSVDDIAATRGEAAQLAPLFERVHARPR